MSKKKILFVSVVFLICTISLLSFCGIIVSIYFDSLSNEGEKSKKIYEYRFRQFSPSKNKASGGFVKLAEELQADEFISYVGENGNRVLISSFKATEYKCVGNCFCDEINQHERRLAAVVGRGLVYFVAATTSIIAYERAKEYFEKECVENFSDECSMSSIKSEVDCEDYDYSVEEEYLKDTKFTKEYFENEKIPREEQEMLAEEYGVSMDPGEDEPIVSRKYLCKGTCIPGEFVTPQKKVLAERWGCDEVSAEAEIDFIDYCQERLAVSYAKHEFVKVHLEPLCKKEGLVLDDEEESAVSPCVAEDSMRENPTVECVKTEEVRSKFVAAT